MANEKAKTNQQPTGAQKPEPPKTPVQLAQEKLQTISGKADITVTNPVEAPAEPTPAAEPAQPSPSTAIETVQPAQVDQKTGQLMLTPKHLDLIKTQIAKDATPQELELFLMMAYRTRLDPLMKQLYFIKYGQGDRAKVSYVTSIDGYRIIAHRTGEFAGVDLPQYEYDKAGKVSHCSITVYKFVSGQKVGFSAKVKFSEYNTNQNNWVKMPETMIAKVAEAHALRKAFPNDLSGIYTQDEMDQAGNGTQHGGPAAPVFEPITKAQYGKVKELIEQKGLEPEQLKEIGKMYKRTSLSKLSKKQAGHLIAQLEKMPDAHLDDITPEDELPDDDSFEAFAAGELDKGEAMPEIDSDQIADDVDAALS